MHHQEVGDLREAYSSENRLLEASGVRANDEENKQQMLLLQCTWGHNLSFLFQKLCYTNIVHCHSVCVCFIANPVTPAVLCSGTHKPARSFRRLKSYYLMPRGIRTSGM